MPKTTHLIIVFMQGILLSDFNKIKKYLYELQQLETFDLPCKHLNAIKEHETNLAEIYDNYKSALHKIEIIINDFELHKKSVRRLIIDHKRCKKQVNFSTQVIIENKE